MSRRPGTFVYVVAPSGRFETGDVEAIVQEDEGTTFVVASEVAAAAGLFSGGFEVAWLTVDVETALDGVGLTAVMSRALADASMPCNVIAGFHHDHLLVPVEMADAALTVLDSLRTAEPSDGDTSIAATSEHEVPHGDSWVSSGMSDIEMIDEPTRATRTCPACGGQAEEDAAFCRHCGAAMPVGHVGGDGERGDLEVVEVVRALGVRGWSESFDVGSTDGEPTAICPVCGAATLITDLAVDAVERARDTAAGMDTVLVVACRCPECSSQGTVLLEPADESGDVPPPSGEGLGYRASGPDGITDPTIILDEDFGTR